MIKAIIMFYVLIGILWLVFSKDGNNLTYRANKWITNQPDTTIVFKNGKYDTTITIKK